MAHGSSEWSNGFRPVTATGLRAESAWGVRWVRGSNRVPLSMTESPDPHHDRPHAEDEAEPRAKPDVVSDPNLDDPTDGPADDQTDEGAPSDWSSEGGATREGPATHSGPAREGD